MAQPVFLAVFLLNRENYSSLELAKHSLRHYYNALRFVEVVSVWCIKKIAVMSFQE